jgi:hypothetical protein
LREKNYNTGLRGVLFEQRHFARMGASVWLYGWLVLRQTHQSGGLGWVLGGSPVSYREIEEETGFNRRTLERWMRTLRRHGYIETSALPSGVVIRITKAKKFSQNGSFARGRGDGRNPAYTVRGPAGGATQASAGIAGQALPHERVAAPIRSSSVDGYEERKENAEIHRDFHNPFHRNFHRQISKKTTNGKANYQQTKNAAQNPNQQQNPSCVDQRQYQLQDRYLQGNEIRNGNQCAMQESSAHSSPQPSNEEFPLRELFAQARMRLGLLRAESEEVARQEMATGSDPEERRG